MAHIIVDAYNFIRRIPCFAEAEREGLESGRDALLMALEEYGAQHGYAITAVFDGGGKPAHEGFELLSKDKFAGIDVVFSGKDQSADAMILEILERSRLVEEMIVVTDDIALRDEAISHGAYIKSAQQFFNALQEGRSIEY